MHTLSLFPSLFTFELLAPTILRLAVALFLINSGWNIYKNSSNKWLGLLYSIFGTMVLVGLFTQAVAVLSIITIKIDWWMKRKVSPVSKEQMIIYVFAGVILLSLLVTGPGIIAFDLPL
ncbi:MAG: hypothetical protein AB201_02555 [Parcubacteria bacterium C7867-006]|nr:MAG: hypothetical protein AB201_02555 [Parcubacteria bacterium C7867-006]